MPTTKDTVAVRCGSSTVFARYFRAWRKTLCRKHLPLLADLRNMPRMRRPTDRNKSPGGSAKSYGAEKITYHCASCNRDYIARRDRTTPICNDCQHIKTNELSLVRRAEQADSRAASLSLDARVADESAMPWERQWTKSMWSRR